MQSRKHLKSRVTKSVRTPRRQQTTVHYICFLPLSVVFQMPRMSVVVKIVPFWSQRQYNFLSALKKRVSWGTQLFCLVSSPPHTHTIHFLVSDSFSALFRFKTIIYDIYIFLRMKTTRLKMANRKSNRRGVTKWEATDRDVPCLTMSVDAPETWWPFEFHHQTERKYPANHKVRNPYLRWGSGPLSMASTVNA